MRPPPSGKWVLTSTTGAVVRAFVPDPLPPHPPLVLEQRISISWNAQTERLVRLDGLSSLLPDAALFVYMYVRREAVLSSQIEGTQSSLSDLLKHEAGEDIAVPTWTSPRFPATWPR